MSVDIYTPYVDGPIKSVPVAISASGDNTLVAAVPGKKIRMLAGQFTAAGTVSLLFKSGSTNLSGAMSLLNSGQIRLDPAPMGHLETAVGEALIANLSGAIAVGGWVNYIEVPTRTS